MKLEDAKEIAEHLMQKYLLSVCEEYQLCGSIRRECSEVNDIDIVAIPEKGIDLTAFCRARFQIVRAGKKIVSFRFAGADVDLYIADENTFETLKLIRTGSAEHNKKLCMMAIRNGGHLYADGRGYEDAHGNLINTEKGILKVLLGKYVEPKERR